MDVVDGNAIGGDLFAAFGHDMTTVVGTCKTCGAKSAVAELRVYLAGPGNVARCSACGSVALVIVCGTVHMAGYELPARGTRNAGV